MAELHRARKRFGQNFLTDSGIIHSIGRAVGASVNDHLVEIGPGKGALTAELIGSAGHMDAVELDRDLIPLLEQQFGQHENFTLHQGDALKFDFGALKRDGKPLRIVGNLPYNISTPLIFHLLSQQSLIDDMHFMLQREVVQRLAASPGKKSYGRLSVMAQYYCEIDSLFDVPPEAFSPQPKVQSAVVRLTPYPQPPHPADNIDTLQQVLKLAFGQRRKTLRNTLKNFIAPEQLEALGIDPRARPETLSVAEFVAISNFADKHLLSDKP
jgi:16S rRNA (adenine1518-N6/adenine1519-N6)-dimethyltransferase